MPSPVHDARHALRWLRQVRLAMLVADGVLVGLAAAGAVDPAPIGPILAVLGALAAVDVAERAWLARARDPGEGAVWAHLAVDLVGLSALVALSGGAHQPLQAFFLVESAVAATVLGRWRALAGGLGAAALQAVAAVVPAWLADDPEVGHIGSHAAVFGFAGLATTWFVSHLSGALREEADRRQAAEAVSADAMRLASLGTLAAGVAHELATPLASIELLAEEAAEAGDPGGTLATLRGQVDRCRAILDRLKRGEDAVDGVTPALGDALEGWVREWRAAHADVDVRVEIGAVRHVDVRGDGDRWRAAVWTLLDNARAAGGGVIDVSASEARSGVLDAVEIGVGDRGRGVDRETASRAGEPFFTRWPGGAGRGLGLYVARTCAQAVGGDVALEARPGGGAVARLWLPVSP